jgi:hypothetical protein
VAHIRERSGADSVDVAFLESARRYKLPRSHPSVDRILGLLREAMANRRALNVRLASLDSGVIEDVRSDASAGWDSPTRGPSRGPPKPA